ncbi:MULTISPECIES: ABC transporter ATP-binding protein [Alteribacter]|uniref:ABC transporter ATP-binding protein n=1 Tax=Alteribacter keqinensis TaxID=2483800 RepID=A0A3M7TXW9_9BACI|nr:MULTISPECIES: ABC transporter ATP-binding protein [Alteribacter]MBM7096326.1 ABC transporter ATP-binding protein [Alteribacter salitolerans]RNA70448.1 ABC transporter ATP-binding protein [Alteribacter keqinensis]
MSLQIENVSRTFNGQPAVEDVSFTAEKGEIVGLLGTSGCGKSTVLRAISGLDDLYEGTVKVNNKKSRSVNTDLGIIFQEARLMPWLNVIDNVSFGLEGPKGEKKEKARTILQQVGLGGFEKYYPKELSGGMAQRTAIARALVTEPGTLLLDEPFSALDAFTKLQLQELLLQIWQDRKPTMIIVTHDIDEALTLCDRIVLLKGQPGKVYKNIEITKARPRAKGDPELARLKESILESLEEKRTVKGA